MSFDTPINRRGTHSMKWDGMEPIYGVDAQDGISMWVADMDFQPPACVQNAVQAMHDHGVYGYYADNEDYLGAIQWWMEERHGWHVDPSWVFTTHGLVNGTAMCVDAFTAPGDGVVLFTPVYHAFAKVIHAAGRKVVECPLVNDVGRYEFDFDGYDAQMTGDERMVILCSPHNPSGRVWSKGELQAVAAFAKRHDLILVSDEIHHDLTFSGVKHTRPLTSPGPTVATSSSKTLIFVLPLGRAWPRWACRPIRLACLWQQRPIPPKAPFGWTNCAIIWMAIESCLMTR